jgi:hypothetical protein
LAQPTGFASLNPSYDQAMIAGRDVSKTARRTQLLYNVTKLEQHGTSVWASQDEPIAAFRMPI